MPHQRHFLGVLGSGAVPWEDAPSGSLLLHQAWTLECVLVKNSPGGVRALLLDAVWGWLIMDRG